MRWLLYNIYRLLKHYNKEYKYKKFREKYAIHESFRFNGYNINFFGDGSLLIRENSYIGENSSISIVDEKTVKIGNNVAMSSNVKIYTSGRDVKEYIKGIEKINTGNVKIGNNTWICSNVVITHDVTIGNNCIIGAGCVITKDVPNNTTVKNVTKKRK